MYPCCSKSSVSSCERPRAPTFARSFPFFARLPACPDCRVSFQSPLDCRVDTFLELNQLDSARLDSKGVRLIDCECVEFSGYSLSRRKKRSRDPKKFSNFSSAFLRITLSPTGREYQYLDSQSDTLRRGFISGLCVWSLSRLRELSARASSVKIHRFKPSSARSVFSVVKRDVWRKKPLQMYFLARAISRARLIPTVALLARLLLKLLGRPPASHPTDRTID